MTLLNRAIAHENSSSRRIGLLENKNEKLEDVGVHDSAYFNASSRHLPQDEKISGYAGTTTVYGSDGRAGFLLPLTILLGISAAVWQTCCGVYSPAPLRFSPLVLRC